MDFKGGVVIKGLLILLLATEALTVGGVCGQFVHGNFYDLSKLQLPADYVLDVSNYNGKLYFNFCGHALTKCPGGDNAFAVFKTDDKCVTLTSSSITSGYNSSLVRYANGTTGLNLTFTGVYPYDGTDIGGNSTYYKIEFDLQCIPDMETTRWDDPHPVYHANNATFVITGEGSAMCPKYSGSFLVDFLARFSFINALFAVLAGSFLSFYGYKLYRPTIFLIGFLLAFFAVGLFLFGIWTSQNSSSYKGYIIFGIALVAGLTFGYLVTKVAWIGLVISGSILGFFISLFSFLLIFFRIVSYPPNLLLYNLIVIGMIGGAIAGYEYTEIILVLSCGISGAYLTVRGLSGFFGGFPNELELASKLMDGQDTGTGFAFYFYLVLMIAMAAGGVWYQNRLKKRDEAISKGEGIADELPENEHSP